MTRKEEVCILLSVNGTSSDSIEETLRRLNQDALPEHSGTFEQNDAVKLNRSAFVHGTLSHGTLS